MAAYILSSKDSECLTKLIELSLKAAAKSKSANAKYFLYRSISNIKHLGFTLILEQQNAKLFYEFNNCVNEMPEFFQLLETLIVSMPAQNDNEVFLNIINGLIEAGTCLAEQQEIDIAKWVIESKQQMIDYWKKSSSEAKKIIDAQVIVANKGKQ